MVARIELQKRTPCILRSQMQSSFANRTENALQEIDLIYFTGDIIDHSIWKASIEDNSQEITYTFDALAEAFPNVVVLPAIGNHEAAPLNA